MTLLQFTTEQGALVEIIIIRFERKMCKHVRCAFEGLIIVNFLLNYLSSNNIFYLYFFLLKGMEIWL